MRTAKVKVLIATESMGGGVLTMIQSISSALSDEIDFVVLYGERDETPDDIVRSLDGSIRLIPWSVSSSIDPRRDLHALRSLRRVASDEKPDVLHAFSSKAGALARIAYPTGRVPICYSPSGYSFLRVDIGKLSRLAFFAIERVLGFSRSLTVACGHGEYRLSRWVSRHAMVICNFFEPPEHLHAESGHSGPRPLRVVSVGRIAPQKNFPLFCRIAERMKGSQIEFQWVGGGEIPADCDVPANVEVTDWIPHERTLEILSSADIYVQTSRYEGLPVTILEALSLGRPVLATPVLGNEELIVEGENGYLCDSADSFAERLTALQADEDERLYLAKTAKLMSEDYSGDRAVKRWRSLYRNFESTLERN